MLPSNPLDKNNYFARAKDNITLLQSTYGQDRVVILGGSGVAWGINNQKLKNLLASKRTFISLGIHANIRVSENLSLYEKYLKKDDIIILIPEIGLIQNNKFINREYCSILSSIEAINLDKLFCSIELLSQKVKGWVFWGLRKDNFGIYKRTGFDDFGNFTAHYSAPSRPTKVTTREFSKDYSTFLKDLKLLKQKFDKLIAIPSVIATVDCSSKQVEIKKFYSEVFNENFNLEFCISEKYQFDSEYHLNYEGVVIKTELTAEILRRDLGKTFFDIEY